MSRKSRAFYFALRKKWLEMEKIDDPKKMEAHIEKMWRLKMTFRSSLRKDLLLEKRVRSHREDKVEEPREEDLELVINVKKEMINGR